ncbi:MAG: LL-diaminopimelate aminotransferase [Firmicutes bacterium]|nr:LL-diaminopimelate aminotransferase [Bacillota bacterium]
MTINNNYLNLKDSYLFSTIAKKVREYSSQNPNAKIIRMGIGDVTRPLVPAVISAMQNAVVDMSKAETFKGYGDEQGYGFLQTAVKGYYAKKGVPLELNEIFIGDGAKSDLGNILDIFGTENAVLIPDPVYPVYVDTNIMHGRKIVFMNGNLGNGFLPMPIELNKTKADIIYLCSPNNPTGAVYTKAQLAEWVSYAKKHNAVILFDSAYEAFVTDKTLPTSIFEIKGAADCAIEFCSLSKTAGFTGTRCGYTVVPNALKNGDISINKLWLRRQTTKFNGVSYVVQRGAEAVFSDEGLAQITKDIEYYLGNAKIIASTLDELGIAYTGGNNSPYIWLKIPNSNDSWAFFDMLLEKAQIVGTPGAGFGASGEGHFRFSAFGQRENVIEAMERLKQILK